MAHPIQKEWMTEKNRKSSLYLDGVKYFCEFAEANGPRNAITCSCPCKKCRNGMRFSFDTVRKHLITSGIDPSYIVWNLHGENSSGYSIEDPVEEEDTETVEDQGADLGDFVDTSYGVHEMTMNVNELDGGHDIENEAPFVPEPNLGKRYNEYKKKAEEKLYPSCEGPETTLSAIVELHNLKKKFGWSATSVTALLAMLRRWLPTGNTVPEKYPIMKEMLKDLGMKAKCIHACVNDCILYWKDNENAMECPKCKAPRFKVIEGKKGKKATKIPIKVLRHFPLVPRLKRLYTIPWIAHSMTWHHRATPSWDYMRHPVDSVQWRECKQLWPDFAKEGRNVWLAIATDGFNPYGVQSSSYSCWPVFIVPYNLPPSLCMKAEFQMMSLLIPGPKAPSQDIDVFLEPLVDELNQLWEGVEAYDMYKKEDFSLRSMLLWGIHDFPAYGNLSGCVTHGYKACPICADFTESIWLSLSKKIVYLNYRLFTRMDHPFRSSKHLRLKTTEHRVPPERLERDELLRKLNNVNYVPGKNQKTSEKRKRTQVNEGGDEDEYDDNGAEVTGAFYKKSILFELDYWSYHKVRHVIDVMHVEKNVAEHIIHTIFAKPRATKDTVSGREDMKQLGIRRNQWMQTDKETGRPLKPPSTFVLSSKEKTQFCRILKDLKLPTGFSSNLSNNVTLQPPGLHAMKSHDYHVIMCYLLPVLLQHAFPKFRDLRRALHQISLFFNLLCSKVLIREDIQEAKYMVAEALCVLEKYFPPSFFDISIHLMVHLADEALLCGPVRIRWMFPFERSMKDIKGIPSNKRYVEGSIAESYLVSESVTYAMEYMPNPRDGNHQSTHESFLDEDSEYGDEGPLSNSKTIVLTKEQFIQIRRLIMFRLDDQNRDDRYRKYRESLLSTTHGKGKSTSMSEIDIQSKFIVDLYNELFEVGDTRSMLWELARGPNFEAKAYKKYRVNGFVFATKSHDDTVATQDIGVCMDAITSFTSSRKDKRPVDVSTTWYGVIRDIIELDYRLFQQVVFYCDWVKVEDKTNGCRLCPDSNLVMVNMSKLKSIDNYNDEPTILVSDARQVFYSKDVENPDWWLVIHSPRRLTSDVDTLDKLTVFQSTLVEQPNLLSLLKSF